MNTWYWTTTTDEKPFRHLIVERTAEGDLGTACQVAVRHLDADPDMLPCPDCLARLMDNESKGIDI